MAGFKSVKTHALAWKFQANKGYIHLGFDDGTKTMVQVESATELSAIAEILRQEKKISYNEDEQYLTTGWDSSEFNQL